MRICGFEKFSMVDWEGKVVCTIFASGCNFRCPFCHNASLALSSAPDIAEEEVFQYLEKRKGLVDGVCISGGEPTLSPDLPDICQRIKNLGYLIKLDTNGTNPNMVKDLVENGLVDYVAMDVKNSPEKYASTVGATGIALDNVLSTLKFLKDSGVDHEFRTTVIGDFHKDKDMESIANLVKGAKAYYIQKYVDRDECISHGFESVPQEKAKEWLKLFEGKVQKCSTRGY